MIARCFGRASATSARGGRFDDGDAGHDAIRCAFAASARLYAARLASTVGLSQRALRADSIFCYATDIFGLMRGGMNRIEFCLFLFGVTSRALPRRLMATFRLQSRYDARRFSRRYKGLLR